MNNTNITNARKATRDCIRTADALSVDRKPTTQAAALGALILAVKMLEKRVSSIENYLLESEEK